MVAPMRTIVPFSTCGRNASCWTLLKRWISSTNRIVRRLSAASRSRASAMIARTSATPETTALNEAKCAPVTPAITLASEVLPVPGGPHRMADDRWSDSIALLRREPGPTMCA